VALSKFRPLVCTAAACFGLAILDQILMPGPANSPIEKMISSPGAAWLMFAFGVTVAPFFEEMFFRGFLLPSLCTACDSIAEKMRHSLPRPLDANGHPQWSLPAMIIGSVLTSIPFAGMHVEQQGHSLGPFLLLIVVSLILCAVRLKFRSLAASTLVHASYNFFIFSLSLVVTGGFRHFDKM
jgi:membrane protease YdiL (CAAX protease family)